MSTVYALRHTATGLCMPQLNGAGYSHWDPTRDDHSKLHPRLFFTRRAATNARSAWARGCFVRETGTTGWETLEHYDETVVNTPPTPRALTDLEIVLLELTEAQRA